MKTILTLVILSLFFSVICINTDKIIIDINNCITIETYNEENVLIKRSHFNSNNKEIYSPQFPEILKTPDKLNDEGKKTGAWTVFLNESFNPVNDIMSAKYYRKATYKDGLPISIVKDYFKSGSIQFEGQIISEFPSVYHGTIVIFFEDNGFFFKN